MSSPSAEARQLGENARAFIGTGGQRGSGNTGTPSRFDDSYGGGKGGVAGDGPSRRLETEVKALRSLKSAVSVACLDPTKVEEELDKFEDQCALVGLYEAHQKLKAFKYVTTPETPAAAAIRGFEREVGRDTFNAVTLANDDFGGSAYVSLWKLFKDRFLPNRLGIEEGETGTRVEAVTRRYNRCKLLAVTGDSFFLFFEEYEKARTDMEDAGGPDRWGSCGEEGDGGLPKSPRSPGRTRRVSRDPTPGPRKKADSRIV